MVDYFFNDDTHFKIVDGDIKIIKLFGVDMEWDIGCMNRQSGIFDIFTSLGRFNSRVKDVQKTDSALLVKLDFGGKFEVVSNWTFDSALKLVVREDYLQNTSGSEITLNRAFSHFIFRNDNFNAYFQNSSWGFENVGKWRKVEFGGIRLANDNGRLTSGATPFLALKNERNEGFVFHLVPNGNWEIDLKTMNLGIGKNGENYIDLLLGQRQDYFAKKLLSNQKFYFPKIIIQNIVGGLDNSTANLHRYFLKNDYNLKKTAPLVYNTWFDVNDEIIAERLNQNLETAKELGFEVFEIDAGWFGGATNKNSWWDTVGDWSQKKESTFGMTLEAFSKKVKSMGMKLGLWIEPERNSIFTPIMKSNPDFFSDGDTGHDVTHKKLKIYEPKVYDYVKNTLSQLIERFDLGWVKVDFNFELGDDETFTEYYDYYNAWNSLVSEITLKYNDVIIESCASGGLRTDLASVKVFDVAFLNDNINTWDYFATFMQASLRLPHYKLNRWVGIKRGIDEEYGENGVIKKRESVIVPAGIGCGWGNYESVNLDFILSLNMGAVLNFTGNLTNLSNAQKDKIKLYIDFYKKYRKFYANSVLYYDSEKIPNIGERNGTYSIQYQNIDTETNILLVTKFLDSGSKRYIKLKNIDKMQMYKVFDPIYNIDYGVFTGKQLTVSGVNVEFNTSDNAARIICIEKYNKLI